MKLQALKVRLVQLLRAKMDQLPRVRLVQLPREKLRLHRWPKACPRRPTKASTSGLPYLLPPHCHLG